MHDEERESTLQQLQDWLEEPMLVLSFIWLALLVVELVWGLNRALWIVGQAIWVIFIAEFALALAVAPRKLAYVRANWLKALALLAPAFRILRLARFARFARASRGVRLLRVVSSVNRGMNALGETMRRRGFGYVLALTLIVTFAGSAGMYALERDAPGGGFDSYASALWWTAMIVTTMGSEYWPKTRTGACCACSSRCTPSRCSGTSPPPSPPSSSGRTSAPGCSRSSPRCAPSSPRSGAAPDRSSVQCTPGPAVSLAPRGQAKTQR